MNKGLLQTVLLLLIVAAQPVAAGVYKWVDENGQVHYGERPPATNQAKRMTLEGAPPPDPEAAERRERRELEDKTWKEERAKRKEEQARAREDAELRKRNCATARDNLNRYTIGGRIYRTDENGERYYVDDEERASQRQKAQAQVDEWCR